LLVSHDAEAALAAASPAKDGDCIPGFHRPHIGSDGSHDPGVLVTEHERHPRQDWDVAVDDMNIAVTESSTPNRHDYLTRARCRRRNLVDL
jgi:hypothetical protein